MTTITEVNTDVHIVKTELFDVNVMSALLRDTARFAKADLMRLSRYKKARKFGNKVEVVYHFGAGYEQDQLGRLFARNGEGLQNFPSDMRNPLIDKYYWDIDMENCHYVILQRLADSWGLKTDAIAQYLNNREAELAKLKTSRRVAKTAFLKIAYGGNIKLYSDFYQDEDGLPKDADLSLVRAIEREMENVVDMCWSKYPQHHAKVKAKCRTTKASPKFSLFSVILQSEERQCLMAIDEFMRTNGRSVDIFIHDGCEIRKQDGETAFPEELLRGAEEFVKERTGYSVHIINKPILHNFEMPEEPTSVEVQPTMRIDDVFAAQKFAELMGDRIIKDNKRVYVFDEGLWTDDPDIIQDTISACGHSLVFTQGDKTFNYSGDVQNTKNLINKLRGVLPSSDGWLHSRVNSDIGKLLYKDGIYDFKTATFTKGFDPEIVFTGRMPRNFTPKNQAIVNLIRSISFDESFSDEDNKAALIHSLMRGVIGDVLRKKFIIGTGFTNSGKGMLAVLLRSCLGQLFSEYNGACLLYKRSGGESAREMGWIRNNVRARIAVGSEIPVEASGGSVAVDGVLLKIISSGVDTIAVRGLYENEKSVVNKATFFMFAQDMPKITPTDEAVRARVIPVGWSYSFVPEDQVVYPYQRKCDPELSIKYATEEFGNAFFWLMVEEYEKWRATGFAEPSLSSNMLLARDDFVPTMNVAETLKDNGYELTLDETDFVPFSELFSLMGTTTKTMAGRLLVGLGLVKKDVKVAGKTAVVYRGIRKGASGQ